MARKQKSHLYELLREARWSIREFSRRTGLSYSYCHKLVNASQIPDSIPLGTVRLICATLGVGIYDLAPDFPKRGVPQVRPRQADRLEIRERIKKRVTEREQSGERGAYPNLREFMERRRAGVDSGQPRDSEPDRAGEGRRQVRERIRRRVAERERSGERGKYPTVGEILEMSNE